MAFMIVLGALSLFLLIPPVWVVLWSVIASFLIFEFLMSRLAKGGKGFFIFGKEAQTKGHAFIILFTLVLVVTGASAVLAEGIGAIIQSEYDTNLVSAVGAGLIANFVICLGLFMYMKSTFFSKA